MLIYDGECRQCMILRPAARPTFEGTTRSLESFTTVPSLRENSPLIKEAHVALHTHRERLRYRAAGPWRPATSIQSSYGVIRRSLSLMVGATVVASSVSGLALAAPYHPTGSEMIRGAMVESVAPMSVDHSRVLAAGFGFQAAGSSLLTVRTYDVPTGAILSEDSFDVSVKEEGAAEYDGNRGRVFAGGIGTDIQAKSKFMLRVYDAETGRFLWEGQLNLLKVSEDGSSKVKATIIPKPTSARPAAARAPQAFQPLFSVRAVNPVTGRLVWQDQFAPGIRKRPGSAGVVWRNFSGKPVNEPIGHIFDLVVRTYDRTSGILLWEDSFEETNRMEEPDSTPETNAYPQAIPFWHPAGADGTDMYEAAFR